MKWRQDKTRRLLILCYHYLTFSNFNWINTLSSSQAPITISQLFKKHTFQFTKILIRSGKSDFNFSSLDNMPVYILKNNVKSTTTFIFESFFWWRFFCCFYIDRVFFFHHCRDWIQWFSSTKLCKLMKKPINNGLFKAIRVFFLKTNFIPLF